MSVLIQAMTRSIVGDSKGLRLALEECRKAAKQKEPVLFQGEMSTGKLLLANYLWSISEKSHKLLLVVDCHDTLVVKEILQPDYLKNYVANYNVGTIYLREIVGLSQDQQKKLLPLLVGLEEEGIRIFFSSKHNIHLLKLEKLVDPELYEYACQWEISLPPLRQRKEDILSLAHHYIEIYNRKLRKSIQGLTPQAEEVLLSYRWVGNVEELKQIICRAVMIADESHISQRHLNENMGFSEGMEMYHLVMPLERMEEILLRSALKRHGFTLEGKKRAARALNISLATLYNKLKRYNINP